MYVSICTCVYVYVCAHVICVCIHVILTKGEGLNIWRGEDFIVHSYSLWPLVATEQMSGLF